MTNIIITENVTLNNILSKDIFGLYYGPLHIGIGLNITTPFECYNPFPTSPSSPKLDKADTNEILTFFSATLKQNKVVKFSYLELSAPSKVIQNVRGQLNK